MIRYSFIPVIDCTNIICNTIILTTNNITTVIIYPIIIFTALHSTTAFILFEQTTSITKCFIYSHYFLSTKIFRCSYSSAFLDTVSVILPDDVPHIYYILGFLTLEEFVATKTDYFKIILTFGECFLRFRLSDSHTVPTTLLSSTLPCSCWSLLGLFDFRFIHRVWGCVTYS